MLKRSEAPIAYAASTIPNIATGAHSATVLASSGASTKKPLPMIDAKGVTVARHADDVRVAGRVTTTTHARIPTTTAAVSTGRDPTADTWPGTPGTDAELQGASLGCPALVSGAAPSGLPTTR